MTVTLFSRVADDLRRDVVQMPAGQKLPSEHDLTKRYKVSRQTVRTALQTLAREGLIVSTQGQGWSTRDQRTLDWVASEPERNTRIDTSPADTWSNGIRAQGREPNEVITTETILASGRIADFLELPPGEPVTVRRRLRYVDRQLHTTSDSYYPRSLVAGTMIELPADVLPGTYAILEAAGHGWRTWRDTLRSRPPTAAELDLFGLDPGVAVTEHTRVRRAADGKVVAVSVTALPGDRNEIIYEGTA
ncbi:GntR family transcriptional regulator [Micromonospora sp. NBC_01796]|uniref:GntR family transcriptional regulator n=1 Tax=Micromonospora sp. NBC_01796 TaxID=2975987 RepID=UPI002DD86E30|nr:GntR family transcriptional regulator [Micromonospora sp. NBC_01796]WSA85613.1 GntR family transcriptional regulator [Micromonospora sp. NBC_01796]